VLQNLSKAADVNTTEEDTTNTKVIWLKAESLTPRFYSPGGSM